MSHKNIVEVAAKAGSVFDPGTDKIPSAYQMSLEDMTFLYKCDKPLWQIIDIVFRFGFVMGNRATISRKMDRL